ncbi:hypothetical protein DFQ10_1253 [Winogradskyella eximia]|uniref:Uncharacterized protein n=1 Tax=Winogradskyella eximia TaxID=262006 RepID=A0A3D9GPI2_9FLAO|nr:hypothetical protein [Winogradskyella eximia]RED37669.1 hypothetical protein DFQ10_1253 [Winogradskyella eximia]
MRKDPEKLYFELITDKNYHLETVEIKFNKLNVDTMKYNLFQVKSAIVFLSRFENEIDSIVNKANSDLLSILNAATVKEERG